MTAKILIVDDDPSIRDLLTRFLEPEGYRLQTAVNGLEALQRVAMESFDLILLDVCMPPGPDGYEVCTQLKADPASASIPVTFLTFESQLEKRARGIAVGADDYLSKPVQRDLLLWHVQSHLRARQLVNQLEPAESVVFTLARTVEARDHYTTGHLRRMEDYSGQLARAAGIKGEQLAAIRYGAILHDVGKIRISEALLNKQGVLTPEEFAQMKQHPEYSAQMISHMRFAPRVTPIVLGHHEKWDGSGYPHGLQGENIPIGARIVAIVDAYDAMTTDRPYRRALTRQEALRRIQTRSGIQWDPELVTLFCSLFESHTPHVPTPQQRSGLLRAAMQQREQHNLQQAVGMTPATA
jgi:putative two-component system response regulator